MGDIKFPTEMPRRSTFVVARLYRKKDAIKGPIVFDEAHDEREKGPLFDIVEDLVGREATIEELEDTPVRFAQKHGYDLQTEFDEESYLKAVSTVREEREAYLQEAQDRLFAEFEDCPKKKLCWDYALKAAVRSRKRGYEIPQWDRTFNNLTERDKFVLGVDPAAINYLETKFREMVEILQAPEDGEE